MTALGIAVPAHPLPSREIDEILRRLLKSYDQFREYLRVARRDNTPKSWQFFDAANEVLLEIQLQVLADVNFRRRFARASDLAQRSMLYDLPFRVQLLRADKAPVPQRPGRGRPRALVTGHHSIYVREDGSQHANIDIFVHEKFMPHSRLDWIAFVFSMAPVLYHEATHQAQLDYPIRGLYELEFLREQDMRGMQRGDIDSWVCYHRHPVEQEAWALMSAIELCQALGPGAQLSAAVLRHHSAAYRQVTGVFEEMHRTADIERFDALVAHYYRWMGGRLDALTETAHRAARQRRR